MDNTITDILKKNLTGHHFDERSIQYACMYFLHTAIKQEWIDRVVTETWIRNVAIGVFVVAGKPTVYRILYEEVDESQVEILDIVSTTSDEHGYDEYRYPRAGECLMSSIVLLIDLIMYVHYPEYFLNWDCLNSVHWPAVGTGVL